jgi:hypothetical protein
VLVQPSDILVEMVVGGEEERMNAYYLQNNFIVNGRSRYVEVKLFDGTEVKGTILDKSIIGQGTDYYVYESIPNSLVPNPLIDITMEDGFEIIKQNPISVYRKSYPSLSGTSYSYFVKGNVAHKLTQMKTIVVPISGVSEKIQETLPVCGDGKCAVLMVDGEKIYLEDASSCPEDCAKKVNWTGIFMVFLIGVLLIVAISLYFRFAKKGKYGPVRSTIARSMLFKSLKDEAQLRDYIAESLASKITKEKIISTLLERGWKKEQIDYVFRRLQSSKK